MVETCIVKVDELFDWWHKISGRLYLLYVVIVVGMLAISLADPLVRFLFFVLHRVKGKSWIWPNEAQKSLHWESKWLLRIGFLWVALDMAEHLSHYFCQWPLWIFGIPLLLWLNGFLKVIQLILVRAGMRGEDGRNDNFARRTLLFDGIGLIKQAILIIITYTIYLGVFDIFQGIAMVLFFLGFSLAIALSLMPSMANMFGALTAFLPGLIDPSSEILLDKAPRGLTLDATLSYIGLESSDGTRTFIPASQSLVRPLTRLDKQERSFDIRVRLAQRTKGTEVRSFLQNIDALMRKVHPALGSYERAHPTASETIAPHTSTCQHNPTSLLGQKMLQQSYVVVEGLWLVRIHGYTITPTREHHHQAISEVLCGITNLIEHASLSVIALEQF